MLIKKNKKIKINIKSLSSLSIKKYNYLLLPIMLDKFFNYIYYYYFFMFGVFFIIFGKIVSIKDMNMRKPYYNTKLTNQNSSNTWAWPPSASVPNVNLQKRFSNKHPNKSSIS
jgi:hypothetical protein